MENRTSKRDSAAEWGKVKAAGASCIGVGNRECRAQQPRIDRLEKAVHLLVMSGSCVVNRESDAVARRESSESSTVVACR